jgi:glycogen debranching enzyme
MAKNSRKPATEPRNVAHAVVSKDQDIFLMSEHGGGVPADNSDGYGLYYHDCRYLDGYELSVAGTSPTSLVSNSACGSVVAFELTNRKLHVQSGTIQSQTFGIRLERTLDGESGAVHDVFTIENYDVVDHELPLSIKFHSDFEDVFVIRGLHPKKVGRVNDPHWHDGTLTLSYNGADGVNRRLEVVMDPKPHSSSRSEACWTLKLRANGQQLIRVSLRIVESRSQSEATLSQVPDPAALGKQLKQQPRHWSERQAEIVSDDPILNAAIDRCLSDLTMLSSTLDGQEFFSAGIPWYGTLFGRDSIIAALEMLAFEPRIAEQTLRLLAARQGTKTDDWKDEQPGKILHELRRGELANLNEIPQTPYYGSVDSTPLFLILVGEHAKWTSELGLFNELRENVERALHWIDNYGDEAGNGYVSYATKSKKGLNNQGWKDSHDAIMNADGSLVTPPVALAEVQGYVYLAKLLIADLYRRSGDDTTATRLRNEADDLKMRFNRDFWLLDKDYYAIALQKNNRPASVIASNPGQALWTGIVDDSRAASVVKRLMAADMFSGWGIRTLSIEERRANPVGYHLGSVWPHDNALIAAGFRHYGFDKESLDVLEGIVATARNFEHNRLPEVFAGYSREQFQTPVRYPVACHPQAWAAGSIPFLMTSVLGLMPDAANHRLRILRPVLPRSVRELNFRRIKIGPGTVDLHFKRAINDGVEVDAKTTGAVEVIEENSDRRVA